MMMLFRISVQWSVEPLIAHLITGLIQLDCFDKSVCSQKVFCFFQRSTAKVLQVDVI